LEDRIEREKVKRIGLFPGELSLEQELGSTKLEV
jgi:hypothetical protein